MSSTGGVECAEDFQVGGLADGVTVVLRVGVLGFELVPEFYGGCEEGAGFTDCLVAAAEVAGAGAVAVAEQAACGLGVEPLHVRAGGMSGQRVRGVVEGFDLLGDGEVLVGDGPVGDAGVGQGHRHGRVFYMRVIQGQ